MIRQGSLIHEGLEADRLYIRVSSKTQDTAAQEADLKAWAVGREDVRWYRDTFTGRTMDRPGWTKLAADMAAGKLGAIVVWRLDRLGRTAKGLTALFDELRERGVNLVSLRDGLDLSTPAGRLMANVLASVAQYETEVRSERQMAGIAAAKERGVRFGRPEGIRHADQGHAGTGSDRAAARGGRAGQIRHRQGDRAEPADGLRHSRLETIRERM
jgi:DNA invertase Pin-like site-specific DNA recombinase